MTYSDRLTGQNVDWYACETKDFIRPSESAQERESQQKLGEKRSKAVQRQPKQNSTWSQTYSFSSRLVDSVYSRVAPLQFLTPMGYPLKFAKLVHLCFIFCRFLQDIIAWNDVTLTFKFLPEKYDEMCPIINIYIYCRKILPENLRIFEVWKSNKKPSKVRISTICGHERYDQHSTSRGTLRVHSVRPMKIMKWFASHNFTVGPIKWFEQITGTLFIWEVRTCKHHICFLDNFHQIISLERVGTHFLAFWPSVSGFSGRKGDRYVCGGHATLQAQTIFRSALAALAERRSSNWEVLYIYINQFKPYQSHGKSWKIPFWKKDSQWFF